MAPAPKHSPAEQAQLVLAAAQGCIEQSSLLDFTMAAIAKRADISVGSLYKHVQTKEDVLVALATQMYRHFAELVETVFALPLNSPQRIMALILVDPEKTRRYCFDEHLDALLNCEAIVQRASPGWLGQMDQQRTKIHTLFDQFWQAAIDSGELQLDDDASIDEINSGSWALNNGFNQVLLRQRLGLGGHSQPLPYPLQADHTKVRVFTRLLNSYHWQNNIDRAAVEAVIEQLNRVGLR